MGFARFSYTADELARDYGTTVEQIETWVKEGQLEGEYVAAIGKTYISGTQIPILGALIDGDPDPQNAVRRILSRKDHAEFLREGEEAMLTKRYPPKKGGELEKILLRSRLPAPKRGERERPMSEKEGQ